MLVVALRILMLGIHKKTDPASGFKNFETLLHDCNEQDFSDPLTVEPPGHGQTPKSDAGNFTGQLFCFRRSK